MIPTDGEGFTHKKYINDLIGYYILGKWDDENQYDESDLVLVLQHQVYRNLPFKISHLLYDRLTQYRTLAINPSYRRAREKDGIKIHIRNPLTGLHDRYHYLPNLKGGLLYLEDETYRDFFQYYATEYNQEYFNIILPNKKYVTSPIEWFDTKASKLYENILWYDGEYNAYQITMDFTDVYMRRLQESRLGEYYTDKKIAEVVEDIKEMFDMTKEELDEIKARGEPYNNQMFREQLLVSDNG